MEIGPLLPGRIPQTLAAQRTASFISAGTAELARLQEQLATQQRFSLASEDPAAAFQTLQLQKLLERKTQALSNISTNDSLLSASESALQNVGDALNTAKGILLSGIGNGTSAADREGLATEAHALLQQVINSGNTKFRGRNLFGGTSAAVVSPFVANGDGTVSYLGDRQQTNSLIDLNTVFANSVSGFSVLGGLSQPPSVDLNPALTLSTKINDLYGGRGVKSGSVVVTLVNGGPAQTQTVDLTGAETIQDIKTRLEDAFAGGPLTLTVDIDPATKSGLRLTPSAGTVQVSDVSGSLTAAKLGIASGPLATISGGDLDPRITLQTSVSALNGGTGISAIPGQGVLVTNGTLSGTVDLSTANTIEDVLNLFRQADLDLDVGLNEAGTGISIGSRRSGADFSIAENGGTTGSDLGILTFGGTTRLSDLNFGRGLTGITGQKLNITRRDGTTVSVDLSTAVTIQDVVATINAVDPGNLVASLKTTGNGLQLQDNSGVGSLIVDNNTLAQALRIGGTGTGPANPVSGGDPSPQEATGTLNVLVRLEKSLRNNDISELNRLGGLIDQELNRVNVARGDLGSRLKLLETSQTNLQNETDKLKESLANVFDIDYADVVTQITTKQFALQALYKTASTTLQMSLLSYL